MKKSINLILALACISLASTLIWDGRRQASARRELPVSADFSPAVVITPKIPASTDPAASGAVPKPTLVFINIRPLVEELLDYRDLPPARNKLGDIAGTPADFHSREEIIEVIIRNITNFVAPESWQEAGGTIGSIGEIGGVLTISQTPEAIRQIRVLLEELHQAMNAAPEPSPASRSGPTTQALGSRVIAYFNIRAIELELGAGKPVHTPMGDEPGYTPLEVIDQIKSFITNTVAPNTWQDAGGTDGAIQEIGGVLVVTQKPENIEAVRAALQNLQAAILRNDFPSIRPAATRNSESK